MSITCRLLSFERKTLLGDSTISENLFQENAGKCAYFERPLPTWVIFWLEVLFILFYFIYWCLYRHLCDVPERFGKKDL